MRDQACKYGAKIETEFVTKLERDEQSRPVHRNLGIGLRRRRGRCCSPQASPTAGRRWTRSCTTTRWPAGLVRYCPICDGYEVTDKKRRRDRSDSHGVAEALFIRSYTADVTLIAPDKALRLEAEDQRSSRRPASTASTGLRKRWRSRRVHRRRHGRRALHLRQHLSGARVGHAHPARPKWSARSYRTTAASRCDATSEPACRASMPPATWSSASTRSATRWAKAASRRRRSATTSARRSRGGASRSREMEDAKAAARRGIRGRGRFGSSSRSAIPGLNGISELFPSSVSISSRSPAP